jgi:hypothetical protein
MPERRKNRASVTTGCEMPERRKNRASVTTGCEMPERRKNRAYVRMLKRWASSRASMILSSMEQYVQEPYRPAL